MPLLTGSGFRSIKPVHRPYRHHNRHQLAITSHPLTATSEEAILKTATMTAALDGHQKTTATGQPAGPAISHDSAAHAGTANPPRQLLDRWPFSPDFRVVVHAPGVVKREG
ncbi:hypothetical protein PQA73_gp33 [Erwinia phage Pavtok]|uniref:Uncharacterized protein n=1 Tax=Erwinia phage Pavtok TaxID=2267655 RepID=A0A345BLZ0_9CAUD|nr:hypothetical protein PQA73_gp33 [Erwinia phage Pavtok]AXF51461.1 hypothetical protein PAVTOK_33 [Erwinia phage Pavtok]